MTARLQDCMASGLQYCKTSSAAGIPAKKAWLQVIPFFLFFILLFSLTSRLPFFWDKDILYSRIAHWLLEHNFSPVLPNDLDTGYPPVLAYFLALAWKLTGKSLVTAHLIMLPFTLGLVWQTRNLVDRLFGGRFIVPAMILLFADTVILSQTVVFSTDLVMLFFMALALNLIMKRKRRLLALIMIALVFTHIRGMFVAGALFIFDIYNTPGRKNPSAIFRTVIPYFPALILFGGWMIFHYCLTGWLLYHPGSPWAGCYERVDVSGLLRNTAILVWRMADFGRLFLWIIPLLALAGSDRKSLMADRKIKLLLVLLSATLLLSIPSMLTYKILNGHRYLIPFFYLFSLLSAYLLFIYPGFGKTRKFLFAVVLAGLISGNFWVYPGKIANGWDATLAHLPYHYLRQKMIRYIDENRIPFDKIGSETPNLAAIRYIDLTNDDRSFPRADLQKHPYIFYSNVFNMFTDEEIDELNRTWTEVKKFRCLQVVVILYKKP